MKAGFTAATCRPEVMYLHFYTCQETHRLLRFIHVHSTLEMILTPMNSTPCSIFYAEYMKHVRWTSPE